MAFRSRMLRAAPLALIAAGAMAIPASAGGVTLRPGDILVADLNAQGLTGAVIRVNPATGQQTAVSSNAINTGTDLFVDPSGIALDAQGRILVADQNTDFTGAVIRVDPATGRQTAVSTNAINGGTDLFAAPVGIALDARGRILVADANSQGDSSGAVIRVNPATGQQTAVSTNAINTGAPDLFADPAGIALDAQGRILVADFGSEPTGSGAVIRVEPTTGQQTLVSNNIISDAVLFWDPQGIALDAQGGILVADPNSPPGSFRGAVIRVDPASGQQTAVSPITPGTGLLDNPFGIALDAEGRILVAEASFGVSGAVIRVDPATGQQTAVSNNIISDAGLFSDPYGLLVVPPSFAKCRGSSVTVAGDAGRNLINGTPARDVIAAFEGNDVIRGLKGNDLVCGGPGRDTGSGGPGKDTLSGDAGGDRLRGGPGGDKLFGGKGRDRLIGGAGQDRLRGGAGRDLQRQ